MEQAATDTIFNVLETMINDGEEEEARKFGNQAIENAKFSGCSKREKVVREQVETVFKILSS